MSRNSDNQEIINKDLCVQLVTDFLNGQNNNIKKNTVNDVVVTLLEVIKEQLSKGNQIRFMGYLTFKTEKRNGRNGVNPRTKEPIHIPSRITAKVIVGTKIKESIIQNTEAD